MRAVVTGAAGFVGSRLALALSEDNWGVLAVDRRPQPEILSEAGILYKRFDLREPDELLKAVSECDVVFHLAASRSVPLSVKDPHSSISNNVMSTVNVLESARLAGVSKVVYASSSSVYGDPPVRPTPEDMRFSPLSPYAASKCSCENIAMSYSRTYDISCTVLRPFNIYGPRPANDDSPLEVVPRFLYAVARGESPEIEGDGEQTRDFVHVEDVVRAFQLAASDEKRFCAYNVGTGVSVSVTQIATMVLETLGSNLEPAHIAPRLSDVSHTRADMGLACSELGFEPQINITEGIKQTALELDLLT